MLGHLDSVKPGLLVLDSVQTISMGGSDGVAGGVTQVRAVTAALVAVAKERGIATVLVGHVTKDGQVAGPRTLEHLVDVVLQFEGDKHSSLRLVRGLKNRFGAADEVGCFEMHERGLTSLPDPSGLFLNRYAEPVPGTCVTVGMEGRRALVTEVQALVGAFPTRRRGAPSAGSTRPGSAWCWPCCSGAARCACTTGRCSRPPSAASGSSSPRPISRWPWRWRRCTTRWRWRPTWWRSARSGSPARSAGSAPCPSGWPRLPGSGFRYALVPPGCGPAATGQRPPAGMRVARGRRHARGRCGRSAQAGVAGYRRLVMSTCSGAYAASADSFAGRGAGEVAHPHGEVVPGRGRVAARGRAQHGLVPVAGTVARRVEAGLEPNQQVLLASRLDAGDLGDRGPRQHSVRRTPGRTLSAWLAATGGTAQHRHDGRAHDGGRGPRVHCGTTASGLVRRCSAWPVRRRTAPTTPPPARQPPPHRPASSGRGAGTRAATRSVPPRPFRLYPCLPSAGSLYGL